MANHRAPRRSASRTGTTDGTPATSSAAPLSGPGKRKAVKPSKASRTLSRRAQTAEPRRSNTPAAPARRAEAPRSRPAEAPAARRAEAPRSRPAEAPAARRAETPARRPEPLAPLRPVIPVSDRKEETPGPRRTENLAARRAQGPTSRRTSSRKGAFPLLPSAPTAVGAAALVIAAAGAMTVTDSSQDLAAADSSKMYTPASAQTGTTAATSSSALANRMRAVSRDSQRAALRDSTNDDLQAAVEQQAQARNAALAQLAASAEKYAGQVAANAWHLPVAPGAYHLTAGFGESSGLWATVHTGLDFAAPTGTPVMAVANGTVTSVGWGGAYGNRIEITHSDGTETWYCHLSAFKVSTGQSVVGGQQIGLVGATGNVTGPHLHLEVRPGAGDPVDPYAALVAHGLQP